MKPLTIEQLKALPDYDWIWVVAKEANKATYMQISRWGFDENARILISSAGNEECDYSDYGTKWLAYKNKEQAEAKGEFVEIKGTCEYCIHNMQRGGYNYGINKPECEYMRLYMKADDFCSKFEAEARLKELQEGL